MRVAGVQSCARHVQSANFHRLSSSRVDTVNKGTPGMLFVVCQGGLTQSLKQETVSGLHRFLQAET